ncbi:MAG: toll/interleukin-1 receptor domain-containing protein [Desulfobacteraceae bacterium]|nr:toll/interleukin-1 receptor domain-containing protein [Desulfobacteraceae bacterium]
MNGISEHIPKVFVSYSHDTPAHKKWVGEFASKLVDNQIDVFFDQWDLSPGDDIIKFMEKSVAEADRVLMICSEAYVRKADDGQGGVGYEAMIVTGELVRDLGTSKFIPVVRQNNNEVVLPKSVSTRFYINLSEGENFDEQFELLLRELHNEPAIKKPPLGKNPFAKQPSGDESPISISPDSSIPDLIELKDDAKEIYKTALELARQGDIVAWRKIIRQAKTPISSHLIAWRSKYDNNYPREQDGLYKAIDDGISVYSNLFVIALAGIESGREKFNNQISLLDDILYPKQWNQSGSTVLVFFPLTVAYIYQALHGAMCIQTDQLLTAVNLAKTKIELPLQRGRKILYQTAEIIGWPETLGGNSTRAWNYLMNLSKRWEWIKELFGDEDEYKTSVCAYYMALNVVEFVDTIHSGQEERLAEENENVWPYVPPCFLTLEREIQRKAYQLLLNDPKQLKEVWRSLKISDQKIKELWPKWIKLVAKWHFSTVRAGFRQEIIYRDLMDDLGF